MAPLPPQDGAQQRAAGARDVTYLVMPWLARLAEPLAAQAVLRHLAAGGYLKRNTELATVAPGQYEVVYTLENA